MPQSEPPNDLEDLAAALINEEQERNRQNAQDMYHALSLIISECRQPTPDIVFIKRCAERAIKD